MVSVPELLKHCTSGRVAAHCVRLVQVKQGSVTTFNNAHVIPEFFICDEVVAISVDSIEGVNSFNTANARGDQCASDLVSLQATKFWLLSMEDCPEWLV